MLTTLTQPCAGRGHLEFEIPRSTVSTALLSMSYGCYLSRSAEFYESMKPQKRMRKEDTPSEQEEPSAGTRAEWLRKTVAMLEPSESASTGGEATSNIEKEAATAITATVPEKEEDSDAVSEHPSDVSDDDGY